MITIRQAKIQDSKIVAPLIYDAIGDIANHLTNENEYNKIIEGLAQLMEQTTNRHSYENTFVAEESGIVLGIVVLYDGKHGKQLDELLAKQLGTPIDVEAHADEYYIDTICVSEASRGKGIGTLLLQFSEQQACKLGHKKLALNVEFEKIQARKLYERQGFTVTETWTITGEPFHHMVKQL